MKKEQDKPLTYEQKFRIRVMFQNGASSREIADHFGKSIGRITRLKPKSIKLREERERNRKIDALLIPGDPSTYKGGTRL